MSVARLRLAPVRETMFPSRAPFFQDRLSARGVATSAAEKPPGFPLRPFHRSEATRRPMSVDQSGQLAIARERLRAEQTVPGLLGATARAYVELLDAPACTISRVIGDLLVDLFQHHEGGKPDRLGHGY